MTGFELTPQERFLSGIEVDPGALTIRSTWSRRLGPVLPAAFGGFFVVGGLSDGAVLPGLVGVLVVLFAARLMVVRWRGLVRATPKELVIRGVRRTSTVPWSEVQSIGCIEVAADVQLGRYGRWWREGRGDFVVRVRTSDGRAIAVPAVSSAGGFGVGIVTAAEAKAALLRRYGVEVAGWRPQR